METVKAPLSGIVLVTTVCSLLLACVPMIETGDGRQLRANSAEFQEYSASVFRRQNAAAVVLVEMLDVAENIDPPLVRLIEEADAELHTACEPLNAAAVARRDGQEVERSTLRQLAEAIPQCDAATLKAESLMDLKAK